jgi:hypothetical protein
MDTFAHMLQDEGESRAPEAGRLGVWKVVVGVASFC